MLADDRSAFCIVDDHGDGRGRSLPEKAVANDAPSPCNIENPLPGMIEFARCPVWIDCSTPRWECVDGRKASTGHDGNVTQQPRGLP